MITYRLGLRFNGKASHAPWRNHSVSPTPQGEGAGEAFFIGWKMSNYKPYPNASFNCETCGKHVVRYQKPSRGPARFCSQSCRGKAFIGVKISAEIVAKRTKFGSDHHWWKGDLITERSGRTRALRAYPEVKPCSCCGSKSAERHHKDGDTKNNSESNIEFLCRSCHMKSDGRLAALIESRRAAS